ncbi:velvet factor domain-containing protein [Trichoderma sp. SZMC 28012]
MNSAYGSSDAPRQAPIGGHGSVPSLPPVVSPSSASNSASLDHLYHHQPRHPLPTGAGAGPHSPIQSQAPPHLQPHFQPHQGQGQVQGHHHQERDHQLPPPINAYNTHPQQPQHEPLPPRVLDPASNEQRDQQQQQQPPPPHSLPPQHILERQSGHRESFSALIHAEGQQVGSASMLVPFSKSDELTGRKYHLDVVQQPRRARMCGFGDKDRRPITPPPCVRLVITDLATGKEIDCNDIDHSMFVLNVDLWNEEGTREVNLVRSSTSSQSATAVSYPYASITIADSSHSTYGQNIPPPSRDATYSLPHAANYPPEYQTQAPQAPQSTYNAQGSAAYQPTTYGPPTQYFPRHQTYGSDAGLPGTAFGGYMDPNSLTKMAVVGGQPQGMFTRNLIGSLAASAFRLTDTTDHLGIWFVLQDLSVRTEGPFRLRFSFVNVGAPGGAGKVNTGRAPILASCFSEVFNVYSAKKFPGVCESTPLSKTFAAQGIKIPIRKDANGKGGDGEDDYVD